MSAVDSFVNANGKIIPAISSFETDDAKSISAIGSSVSNYGKLQVAPTELGSCNVCFFYYQVTALRLYFC